jgi:ribonuclease VapC
MVIDTSAITAILLREPDALLFAEAIENGTPRLVSAATLLDASMVIKTRKGEAGGQELDLFIYRPGIEIVPLEQEQAEVARVAWRQYGKNRHPADLNYGDCFAMRWRKSAVRHSCSRVMTSHRRIFSRWTAEEVELFSATYSNGH